MQIDDNDSPNYSTSGAIIELWDKDDGEYQQWQFTHLRDDYYKITSVKSGLALSVAAENVNTDAEALVQESFANLRRQWWKVSLTAHGMYKISPMSGESYATEWVMCAGYSMVSVIDGRNVEQRAYTDDTNYKDEWFLIRADVSNSINVDLLYDAAYAEKYSSAQSRIVEKMNVIQEKYWNEFGISIHFNSPVAFESYADANCTSYSTDCDHAEDSDCANSLSYASGNVLLETYHHKNIYNNMYRIPFPDLSSSVKMAFIGHNICGVVSGQHRTTPVYGLTNSSKGLLTITSSDISELFTMTHELGHLFYAPDHYGGAVPSTEEIIETTGDTRFSMDCIYGENKATSTVFYSLTICDGCKAAIQTNAARFNH